MTNDLFRINWFLLKISAITIQLENWRGVTISIMSTSQQRAFFILNQFFLLCLTSALSKQSGKTSFLESLPIQLERRGSTNPISWGCIILTALLQRAKTPRPNLCPGYDTKLSQVLELWGMQSVSSLPLPSGSRWTEVQAPSRVLSMGQIQLLTLNLSVNKWLMMNWIKH